MLWPLRPPHQRASSPIGEEGGDVTSEQLRLFGCGKVPTTGITVLGRTLPIDPTAIDLSNGAFDIRIFSCTILSRYLSWRNTLG